MSLCICNSFGLIYTLEFLSLKFLRLYYLSRVCSLGAPLEIFDPVRLFLRVPAYSQPTGCPDMFPIQKAAAEM